MKRIARYLFVERAVSPVKLSLLFIFLLLIVRIDGSVPDSLILSGGATIRVDSIKIKGNDITEDFIILRELTFKERDTIGAQTLEYNKERIFSLGLFSYVNLFPVRYDKEIHLVIEVKEAWYIYPIPFVNLKGNNFEETNYGINFLYRNFRGRNETLRAILSFGYNPFFRLLYNNPVFIPSEDISFNFELYYQDFGNRSEFIEQIYGKSFDYKFIVSQIGLAKRFNQFNFLSLSLRYQYVEAPAAFEDITASDGNIDRLPGIGIGYLYDSRDLAQFPENGLYTSLHLSHRGFGINGAGYNITGFDFREYRNFFGNLIVKWRLTYRHTFGHKVPRYDYSYFGYDEFVRGHREDKREGNNYLLGSAEMYFRLFRDLNISLDLPILPRRLTSARLGLYIGIFGDTGTVYNNGEKIFIGGFDSGWGVGIALLVLPFTTFRFEYAFDEYRNGEYLIGTGFSF